MLHAFCKRYKIKEFNASLGVLRYSGEIGFFDIVRL